MRSTIGRIGLSFCLKNTWSRKHPSPADHRLVRACRQDGRTLLEMIIVVAVIGLLAAIAIPSLSPTLEHRLALAASEVADVLRFAREEARLTGSIHGVSIDLPNNLIKVFRLDQASSPNLRIYDVYHPVSKQLYVVNIDSAPYSGVGIKAYGGQTIGSCTEPGDIAFGADGVVRCALPVTTRINNATVEITANQVLRTVRIDSYSGRVTVE